MQYKLLLDFLNFVLRMLTAKFIINLSKEVPGRIKDKILQIFLQDNIKGEF